MNEDKVILLETKVTEKFKSIFDSIVGKPIHYIYKYTSEEPESYKTVSGITKGFENHPRVTKVKKN